MNQGEDRITFGIGDCDGDGDIDLHDCACMQRWFGTIVAGECEAVNLAGDAMIDLANMAALVAAITGPQ